MKKILAIILAAMMILSLAACGDNKPSAGKDSGKTDTQQSDAQKTPDKSDDKKDDKTDDKKETGLNLPQNFHMIVPGLNLYKIGDDFMNSTTDFYRYIGNGQYEIYYKDNDQFIDSGVSCGMESFLDITVNTIKNATKTTDTKDICGVTCAKYTDSLGTEYYVYEETGLIFEVWYEGATKAAYTVSEWDTSITAFPCEAPK